MCVVLFFSAWDRRGKKLLKKWFFLAAVAVAALGEGRGEGQERFEATSFPKKW